MFTVLIWVAKNNCLTIRVRDTIRAFVFVQFIPMDVWQALILWLSRSVMLLSKYSQFI